MKPRPGSPEEQDLELGLDEGDVLELPELGEVGGAATEAEELGPGATHAEEGDELGALDEVPGGHDDATAEGLDVGLELELAAELGDASGPSGPGEDLDGPEGVDAEVIEALLEEPEALADLDAEDGPSGRDDADDGLDDDGSAEVEEGEEGTTDALEEGVDEAALPPLVGDGQDEDDEGHDREGEGELP